jgi:hypothetical protein
MKYLKMLGLAALASGALMAFAGAGTASATELTCSAGVMCTAPTTIHAVTEGHAVLDSIIGNIECNGTVSGTASTGSSTTTPSGSGTVTFSNCTEGAIVNVLANGTLEVHTDPANGTTANGNGVVTSNGTQVTVEFKNFHCIFETQNTEIGTLTGSVNRGGSTATLDISARIPRVGGRSGIFCGSTAPWTGSYEVTTPMYLDVD